jgi:hypothetical protein
MIIITPPYPILKNPDELKLSGFSTKAPNPHLSYVFLAFL